MCYFHGVLLRIRHNAEADQRRTKDSDVPLDASRRLIQRMVLATWRLRSSRLGVAVGA